MTKKVPKKYCLCKSLQISVSLCRIFGLFPISWCHIKDQQQVRCQFRVSRLWLIYSLIIAVICGNQAIQSGRQMYQPHIQSVLPVLLSGMNETIYSILSTSLILCHMIRAKKMVESLNKIAPLINNGLMCDSASKILIRLQYVFTALISLHLIIQFVSLFILNFADKYITNWDYDRFIVRFVSNIPFMFYLEFCTLCALYISFFGCFEKMVIKTLQFKHVHPLQEVNETNNSLILFGCIKYNICNEEHTLPTNDESNSGKNISSLEASEMIEKLRCLHEQICISIRETNNAMNPQLLVLIAMELAVLVIHWYSVIIYLKYNNITAMTNTINFFNWIFIFTHSAGIWLFLRSGQQVMSMFNGLTDFLLEYSTRHLSLSEHQQIRIFINKLRFSSIKLNASGVVSISLSLTAPIYGNVLTYVLVALQFRAPENT